MMIRTFQLTNLTFFSDSRHDLGKGDGGGERVALSDRNILETASGYVCYACPINV